MIFIPVANIGDQPLLLGLIVITLYRLVAKTFKTDSSKSKKMIIPQILDVLMRC